MPAPTSTPRFSRLSRPRRRAYISLTPLIDVVFILLVFFMLASSFLDWRSILLDAPATAGRQGSEAGAVLLRVGRDGALDLNGRPVARDALGERLAPLLTREPSPQVLIRPGPGVAVQTAIDTLDAVKAAGAARVRLLRGAEVAR